jgi:ribosome-associated protein
MKCEQIFIHTPFIRLDSFLKLCGEAGTGGHAKILILENEIQVNGEVCPQRGKKLYPGALVQVRDRKYEVSAGEG